MSKNILSKGKKGGMQIATLCISTTMVLVLLGMIAFFVIIARNVSNSVKENLTVTLMLSDSTTVNDGHELTRVLYHRPYTHFVDYIGKEEILKDESKQMGINPKEFLDENPFSSTIELTLKADFANKDSLKWIEKEWKKEKAITDITYQKDLINTVNDNIRRISIVLLILVAVFLLISISLINNTIRLGVYSQRFKMHTMKLVGASYGYIRKPFMWRMFLVGIISSIFACIILAGGIYALFSFEPEVKEIISVEVMVLMAASVFVLGLVISLACGFFSVNRFLRMKASDLYKI
ncbi:MAG: permease-like cell division protein FtsX [Prevotellaceae bacterium]|nr:permease-like cell division protein FtsX [Prevotellaceae bacterium]